MSTKHHRFHFPPPKRILKQSALPSPQSGWGTIIFMIFIVFMISKCSDHHDNGNTTSDLPARPSLPDETSARSPHDGDPYPYPPYLPAPENHESPTPQPPTIRANGSEKPKSNWYVPNENIGSGNHPSILPTDEREPSWIIPKEENQRAP